MEAAVLHASHFWAWGQQCWASYDLQLAQHAVVLNTHGSTHVQRLVSPVMGMQGAHDGCCSWPGDLAGGPGHVYALLLCWSGHELPCDLT
jgi:hypothetical protein